MHVTPDFIARLPYHDRWQENKTRLLDASAFCLRSGERGDEVEFLARGSRWQQLHLDGKAKSRDGYEMKCHVAVHVSVNLDLTADNDALNRYLTSLGFSRNSSRMLSVGCSATNSRLASTAQRCTTSRRS